MQWNFQNNDVVRYGVAISEEVLGPSAPVLIQGGLIPAIRKAAEWGFDSVEVHVRNPLTGAVVSEIGFGTGPALGMATLPDFGSGPADEMILLGKAAGGEPRTYTRDCLTGDLIRDQNYFNTDWQAMGLVELPNLQASGSFPEIGVLGRNRTNGEIAVQIRDGATGQFVKNLFFFNSNWAPIKAIVVPDLTTPMTGDPEVGVLAIHNTNGQIAVMMKDAATNTFVGNVFFLNANWQPVDVMVVDGMPGTGDPVLALLATQKTTGQVVTMLKDAATNGFLVNLFNLGSNWQPTDLVQLGDMGGGTAHEVAVLGVHKDFGRIVAQSRDGATNAFIKNARPLGSAWLLLDMVLLSTLHQYMAFSQPIMIFMKILKWICPFITMLLKVLLLHLQKVLQAFLVSMV